jgi:cyclopropane-fatty-acyl-phospholipid synthase
MVAAGEFGARATGVTLSREQLALASERIRDAGLADRIELRLQDYRTLEGTYSAIASTEMIEALGHRELPRFFASVDRLLAPNGIACIQAIAMPDQRYARYRRSRDWMSEYIFPGGNLPSLEAMTRAMASQSQLVVANVEDIGIHYARTLELWRDRFESERAAVLALRFDEKFIHGWRFYLASCEAAFRARSILDDQLLLTRTFNDRLPDPTRTAGVAVPASAETATLTPRQKATSPVVLVAASCGVG